ncbi:MAG: hypothetical protein EBE86_035555 [Hormoscilla sp. GUM202]|nr:hypothetical protein [Hormoscilla sp. GUM202]
MLTLYHADRACQRNPVREHRNVPPDRVQTPYRVYSRLWDDRGLGDVAWCCIAEEKLSVGIFPDRRLACTPTKTIGVWASRGDRRSGTPEGRSGGR